MLKIQKPKILIIGAGAVGRVFGHHLALGGAEVSVLVKPKYKEEAIAGYSMKRHRLAGVSPQTHRFMPQAVYTSLLEARGIWHQVWICVPSTALRDPWIVELQHTVGDATVVLLTPGIHDLQTLAEHYPANKIVCGMISMVSYQAPLPGQDLEPCTAYYFPPFSPSPFQGPQDRATSVVEFLQRGGCPASVVADARVQGALASSVMMPIIVGLEHEGWDIARFKNSTTLLKSLDAAQEALNIVKAEFRIPKTLIEKVLNPKLMKFALSVAPSLTPFPLQSYLQVHFTKVRPQTDAMMQRYIMLSETHNLPASRIAALYALWRREVAASLSQALPVVTTPAPAPTGYSLPPTDPGTSQNFPSTHGPADTSLTIGIVEGLEEETDA